MKFVFALVLVVFGFATSAAADWREDYTELLQKYVIRNGVDYASWAANSADQAKLKSVVDAIGEEKLTGNRQDQLAYYINAYNAWILYYFVDGHPRENNNAIKRGIFFKTDGPVVAGEEMSFDDLENGIIRPEFDEPRIHFALNCGAKSCPPLFNRAFSGETLDADLTALAEDFLNNNSEGIRFSKSGKTAYVSEIFKWFSEDFGDLKTFINQYRDEPLGEDVKIRFQNYDWSRNDPN